ncbi:MAG: NUDIX domain-containing protein [Candidatus Jorgensenbacteria bacterium]
MKTREEVSIHPKDAAVFAIIDTAEENIPRHVKVLLIQDGDTGPNFWKIPGGKKKKKELWNETARRELEEELGVSLKISSDELFSTDLVEGPNVHEFVVFAHSEPSDSDLLKRLRFSPGITGVHNAAIFNERQLVGLLNSGLVLEKHERALQKYLVEHGILLR